ncbi:hypothetical protein SAMN02910353_02703 [Ruminococcus sp. YRD2003]|uniref:hypothetical protein n=1 Tax=Ruminococcus sp. YRD2003 TaxID=1452313 RepID=UPI0008CCD049|nr:hypothetical protein SAMN02910353_02703 [Ruminococcus flavefaciens]
MKRKSYNPALIMFPIGLLEMLLVTGVPVGKAPLPIAAVVVFALASIAVIVLSATIKGNIRLFVTIGALFLATLTFIGIVEVACADKIVLLAVGWFMGACTGVGGIIKSVRNRGDYKVIMSVVFNSLTVLIALITAAAELVTFRGLVILEKAAPAVSGQ